MVVCENCACYDEVNDCCSWGQEFESTCKRTHKKGGDVNEQ